MILDSLDYGDIQVAWIFAICFVLYETNSLGTSVIFTRTCQVTLLMAIINLCLGYNLDIAILLIFLSITAFQVILSTPHD